MIKFHSIYINSENLENYLLQKFFKQINSWQIKFWADTMLLKSSITLVQLGVTKILLVEEHSTHLSQEFLADGFHAL